MRAVSNIRERLECKCGAKITGNTYKTHIKTKCVLSESIKKQILHILDLKTKHNFAWAKELGKEAIGDKNWFISIINESSTIDQWSFEPPRKIGENPPSKILKMKTDRLGVNNPSCKTKPVYDLKKLSDIARQAFEDFTKDTSLKSDYIHKTINSHFPDYLYNILPQETDKKGRGINTKNKKIALLTDIDVQTLTNFFLKRRGVFILSGQKKSPLYDKILSEGRKALRRKKNISKAHEILFEMISFIDPNAENEYQISYGNTWKSYDIYSPKFDCLIEMHGRAWHDLDKCPEKLKKVVTVNVLNDSFKEKLARNLRKKFVVFWDDEMGNWNNQIHDLFNEGTMDVKQAKGIVDFRRK